MNNRISQGFLITVPQIGASFVYAAVYEGARASMRDDFGIQSVAVISGIAGGLASMATQVLRYLPLRNMTISPWIRWL